MRHLTPSAIRLALLALLGLALIPGETARAITDTVFRYSTVKQGYLSVPSAAFTSGDNTNPFVNNGLIARADSASSVGFVAPALFPDGARLRHLTAYYKPVSGQTIFVQMWRQKLSDGSLTSIVFQGPSGTSGVRTHSTYAISDPATQVVDNEHYSYYLNVNIGGNGSDFFYGMRIQYTYNNAGD
jgi:hypothetical protein